MKLRIIHDNYYRRYFVQKKVLFWWKTILQNGICGDESFWNGFDSFEQAAQYEKWYIEKTLKNLRDKYQDKLRRTAKNRIIILKQENVKVK